MSLFVPVALLYGLVCVEKRDVLSAKKNSYCSDKQRCQVMNTKPEGVSG